MGRSDRVRAFTAALVVALVGLTAFAAAASALPARFWGVVPQSLPSEEQFQRLQRGGVKTIRISIDWAAVQPARNGEMTFASIDPMVERAAKANIEVLPFLSGAPGWAVPAARVPGDPAARAPSHLPAAGSAGSAWVRFVKATVARYGTSGSFWSEHPGVPRRPIKVWQIWNEPNFKYFVAKPNPAEFGRLVKNSYAAIKSVDSSGQLLLGGLFALPKGCAIERKPKSICATDFLSQMYKRTPGIKGKFNAVALHPYSKYAKEVGTRIEEFRKVLAANKDGAKPLWITELSWSSQHPVPGVQNVFAKGEGGQARELRNSFALLRGKASKWRLQRLYWFSIDDAVGTCNFCDGSGLFGDGFVPKQAWYAYVKFAGGTP